MPSIETSSTRRSASTISGPGRPGASPALTVSAGSRSRVAAGVAGEGLVSGIWSPRSRCCGPGTITARRPAMQAGRGRRVLGSLAARPAGRCRSDFSLHRHCHLAKVGSVAESAWRGPGAAMTESKPQVDLLVLGGGMAGLSAAARAVRDGARVTLVEKGPAIGGSAVYAGFIWTAPTVEVMRRVNPDADPDLADLVVEKYAEGLDFVRSLDVHVAEPVTVLGYGRGCATDMANYLLACERLVRDRGEVVLGATVPRLLVEDGAVVGAEVETSAGGRREIRATHTL